MNKIDFDAINAMALASFESLLRQWLPDGKKSGAEYSSVNPTRNDSHVGSFSINIFKGVWQDFATGDGGSDPVSLYAYLFHHNDQGAAAKELGALLGVDSVKPVKSVESKKPTKASPSDWMPMIPPENAPEAHKAHIKRGIPEQVWCYRSASGSPLGYVYKFNTSDGGKVTLPLSWCRNKLTGAEEWRWMAFAEPRWLYGMDRLNEKPRAPVLVVEGEKCADVATAELPHLACVSWPGGCKAVAKADWSPLAGRDVIIWPDCDSQKNKAGEYLPFAEQPGMAAANRIADKLLTLGCRVWLMDIAKPGEKPSGWDVADVVDEGLTGDDLVFYLRTHSTRLGVLTAPASPDFETNDSFTPITSAYELLARYSLIYGHGGTVFDHKERIMLKHSDMVDACINRDFAKKWQSSAARKIVHIDNVGFDPGEKEATITCNLWGGWPTVPIPGVCEKLLILLRYMCNHEGDNGQLLFDWIIRWLAYPIQYPGAKMKTAVVVHGPQGTGKSLIFESILVIYGKYGRIIGQDAIEDKFNDWASKKLFLIADEVVARSDLYHVKNKLKSFITGDWIRINPKNLNAYDERNHVNMIFLSNERMPVVLEEDDRRHAVIWTPEKLSADFYQAVAKERSNGGDEAFHDYLLHVDLEDFNEHTPPPMTAAKKDLIDLSKDTISRFYEEWESGHIDGFKVMPVLSEDFYELYRAWCVKQGVKPGPLVKMVDMMIKRLYCTKRRCRYVSMANPSNNPKTFIFSESCDSVPSGFSEMGWLGKCVNEFHENMAIYRVRNREN
jgi:hypothetical protein